MFNVTNDEDTLPSDGDGNIVAPATDEREHSLAEATGCHGRNLDLDSCLDEDDREIFFDAESEPCSDLDADDSEPDTLPSIINAWRLRNNIPQNAVTDLLKSIHEFIPSLPLD